jgi:hypothetical protein
VERLVVPGNLLDIWPLCLCWVRGRVMRCPTECRGGGLRRCRGRARHERVQPQRGLHLSENVGVGTLPGVGTMAVPCEQAAFSEGKDRDGADSPGRGRGPRGTRTALGYSARGGRRPFWRIKQQDGGVRV